MWQTLYSLKLTFLTRCLTGRRPPATPHTLSKRTIPCFILSSRSASLKALLFSTNTKHFVITRTQSSNSCAKTLAPIINISKQLITLHNKCYRYWDDKYFPMDTSYRKHHFLTRMVLKLTPFLVFMLFQWVTFDIVKFSLIARPEGHKQKKWVYMVIQFPLFVSTKLCCQAEFEYIESDLTISGMQSVLPTT